MKKTVILFVIALFAFGAYAATKTAAGKTNPQSISIKIPGLVNMKYLPVIFTADGAGMSPFVLIENVPANAKSLVLIMDDLDAPNATFVHWLIFNIPAKTKAIMRNHTPAGAAMGKNSAGVLKYVPPSPPPGKPHRYIFNLYALDRMLDLKEGANKDMVVTAMQGHVIVQTSLTGLHKRK